ncbi:hypothetical protein DQR70_06010 [Salmonella enterica subsp. enterica serovar Oslo]|nr:hypothetical protein [Salmonella enterica subsp. enterica serovar Oslo]
MDFTDVQLELIKQLGKATIQELVRDYNKILNNQMTGSQFWEILNTKVSRDKVRDLLILVRTIHNDLTK